VLATGESFLRKSYEIHNTNRTVGTMLGSELTRRFGGDGLPDATIDLTFHGRPAGFGASYPRHHVAPRKAMPTDYFGKGLSGGTLVLRPARTREVRRRRERDRRGTCPYGGDCRNVFIRGVVGERFCVRNSGATAVVEASATTAAST